VEHKKALGLYDALIPTKSRVDRKGEIVMGIIARAAAAVIVFLAWTSTSEAAPRG
jgi:hypothetical protein